MSAYVPTQTAVSAREPRGIHIGIKRLALAYVWITIACSGIVFAEPAPCDALMVGLIFLLPVVGLVRFTPGIALYMTLWAAVVATGFIGATQAGEFATPIKYTGITLYLALSSVVLAAFVLERPVDNVRLIMSAYVAAAVIAAAAALIGYFNLVPGAAELFTFDYVRARGTFKDPNVLGPFLVAPLLYVLNKLIWSGHARASLSLLVAPILLLALVLSFSRGAWFNLALSGLAYAYLTFAAAGSHRQRLKLTIYVVLGAVFSLGVLVAALNVPKVAELMEERSSLQSYDVGPEGRFGGQERAVGVVLDKPLGIGALEFGRLYQNDVHQVYLNMFLNGGWIGGTLYLALVLLTIGLGVQQVMRDRGTGSASTVLVAAFIGIAAEGVVIDTDHWRHFYLIMAMIWGMALAPAASTPDRRRAEQTTAA